MVARRVSFIQKQLGTPRQSLIGKHSALVGFFFKLENIIDLRRTSEVLAAMEVSEQCNDMQRQRQKNCRGVLAASGILGDEPFLDTSGSMRYFFSACLSWKFVTSKVVDTIEIWKTTYMKL